MASTPNAPDKLLDDLLQRPLFAHLSTVHEDGPRESPVWFLWEKGNIWILGNMQTDSFPARIGSEPRCALGIVDFNPAAGLVQHTGIRGRGCLLSHDRERISRLFYKYSKGNGDDEYNYIGCSTERKNEDYDIMSPGVLHCICCFNGIGLYRGYYYPILAF